MLHGIYSSAHAMESASRHQEMIAQNLAHASMPAYRRLQMRHGTFDDTLLESQEQMAARSTLGVRGLDAAIDWQPGSTTQTGRKLDIAIEGSGFFEIETPQGSLYTRNGNFGLNDRGELVTQDGYLVQGTAGPITLNPQVSLEQLQVSPNGNLVADGIPLGQIRVVDFENLNSLTKVGATSFSASNEAQPTTIPGQVRSGFLERSNVQPIQELVDMIASQRQHDAAARSLRTIMQSIEKRTNLQGSS